LEWEVLRWRRLKLSLIRARGLKALERFLREKLDYDLYEFIEELAEDVVREYARNEPAAVDYKVNEVLADIEMDTDSVLDRVRAHKAKVLVREYVRRKPDAVTLVHELLSGAGMSMDIFMADALAAKLDDVERIDHLTAIAESRRNASLHEADRRRAVLGETLRRSVQEIEDGEFEVIETTPAKGKDAA
jgi:hypothetical protein